MANIQSGAPVDLSAYTKVLQSDNVAVSHTGDTALTLLKSYTIPAKSMGANGTLRCRIWGYSQGSVNNKDVKIYFNGTLVAWITNAANVTPYSYYIEFMLGNQNDVASQRRNSLTVKDSAILLIENSNQSAFDTAADITFEIKGQLVDAGEAVVVTGYSVEVYYKD